MKLIAYPVIDLAATGRNIRRLRLEKRLTVRDLQGYFGFEQPQAIYKWQSGKSLPTVDNLLALSVLLGVPMEQILVFRNNTFLAEQQGHPCCSCLFIIAHKLPPVIELLVQFLRRRRRPEAMRGMQMVDKCVLTSGFLHGKIRLN